MPEDLSLNDIVMPKCYTRVVWIFDYVIDDLEKPLLEFLHTYCPTAFHRIVYDDEKKNYGQLVESTTSTSSIFSSEKKLDMLIAHYINCSFQELDVFPYSGIPTETSPLFFLHQVNVQDGTLLAVGIHHHFSDGHGLFSLMDRFSNWIREKDHPKVKPFIHDRSLLKPAAHVQYDHPEYTTVPPVFALPKLPSMDVIVKKYTKRQLFDKLKITASNVTLNDVLVAWLTQAISQIRQVPLEAIINVGMACDGRSEWNIGPDYFGNCNFYMCMQFPMADLNNGSVDELAQKVNIDKKKSMSRDYMASALAYIKSTSETVHPGFNAFCGQDLAFTNWSRFPAYQVDFGRGPTKRIALPPARWDGLILVFPTPTDEVELYIGLREDHAVQLLKKLESL